MNALGLNYISKINIMNTENQRKWTLERTDNGIYKIHLSLDGKNITIKQEFDCKDIYFGAVTKLTIDEIKEMSNILDQLIHEKIFNKDIE